MTRRPALLLGLGLALVSGIGALVLQQRRRTPSIPTASESHPTGLAAAAAPVSVRVLDDGAPCPDRWVVFHDARGTVISSSKSNANGMATAAVPEAGGMVTVAYGTSIRHLITVAGVRPGESIVVGETEDEGDDAHTVANARVRLPGGHRGATHYSAALGVGRVETRDAETPVTVSVFERYTEGGPRGKEAGLSERRFRVFGEALGPADDPLAFSFGWAELGHVDDGGVVEVKLPPWSTAYRRINASLVNPPPGVRTARGQLDILTSKDTRFERPAYAASIEAETKLPFLVPEALGDDVALRLELGWDERDKAVSIRRGRAVPTMRIDLSRELLPRVERAIVDQRPDATRPLLRWAVAGDASKANATVARLTWPTTGEHVWTIILSPTTAPPFEVPALPSVLAEWRPDQRPSTLAVAIVESSSYRSYDDVRKKGIGEAAEAVVDDAEGWLRWSSTGDIGF